MTEAFIYNDAFSRNLGWVTEREQETLRGKTVAIAGLGGVGGVHLLTLARLGIGSFHVADFDHFSMANFNRQIGASMSSLHQPKLDVLTAMARDINPELQIKPFPAGVDGTNLDAFLAGVDVYIDGLDFFAFDARRRVFSACARLGIPAVTVAPVGMGAALINFLPGRMTFDEYFQWGDLPEEELALRFLVGLAPARLHQSYLVDRLEYWKTQPFLSNHYVSACILIPKILLRMLLRNSFVKKSNRHRLQKLKGQQSSSKT